MEHKGRSQQEKGKGNATEPSAQTFTPDAGQAEPATAGQPLVSRIAASASHLTGALFSGPPGPKTLSVWYGDEKGGSSGQPSITPELAEASRILLPSSVAGPQGPAFGTGHTTEHIARQEESFAAFLDISRTAEPPVTSTSSVREQEDRDGRAAVALLSAHDEEAPDISCLEESAAPADTAEIRKALFGDGSTGALASEKRDDLVNFIPDYLRVGQNKDDTGSTGARAEEAFGHLGTADLHEGWHVWVNQWSGVLARYQDEVWGDLATLVKEARAEVEELAVIRANEKPVVPKALLRLRNILGHIRGF